MVIHAANFADYLEQMPEERRGAFQKLRDVIAANIDPRFEEGMQYNFPSWFVPHSIYPGGYHCDPKQPLPFMSIGSQKHFVAWYACFIYQDDLQKAWFVEEFGKTGQRLDMGKSCVRFKKMDKIPFDLIGEAVKRISLDEFVAQYELARK